MKKESENSQEKIAGHWYINMDWYQQNQRSFLTLAKRYLCSKCAEKMSKAELTPEKVIAAIRDCCSHHPDFMSERLPILERIFCVFLANDNQPLDLEELGNQLNKWHSYDTYRTSPEILSRLLNYDQYYGFCKVSAQ